MQANYNIWVTNEIVREGEELQRLFWLMTNTGLSEIRKFHKIKKREHQFNIKLAKSNYYNKDINNSTN